jgi:hypothetical protein
LDFVIIIISILATLFWLGSTFSLPLLSLLPYYLATFLHLNSIVIIITILTALFGASSLYQHNHHHPYHILYATFTLTA